MTMVTADVTSASTTIAALYHFTAFGDTIHKLQRTLLKLCLDHNIRGTLLLAREGINGTISGPKDGIAAVIDHIQAWPEVDHKLNIKYSYSCRSSSTFSHIKVKVKSEIVTMGKPDLDIARSGSYVEPEDWNQLISRDDVVVIDARNDYEVQIGRFKRAVDPKTKTFRDFPAWAEQFVHCNKRMKGNESDSTVINDDDTKEKTLLSNDDGGDDDDEQQRASNTCDNSDGDNHNSAPVSHVPTAVAMYCTGGIRCEKATAWVRELGVREVFHLRGGILRYLERIPADYSLWEGECFVFDDRVAVTHGLQVGSYSRCYACKMPLSRSDVMDADTYEEGVHCRYCKSTQTDAQRQRFHDRQQQILLSRQKGEHHLGQRIDNTTSRRDGWMDGRM